MKKACFLLIITLLALLGSYCYAQAPTVSILQIKLPQTPKVPTIPTGHSTNPYNPHIPSNGFNQQAHQEAVMQEVQAHQRLLQEAANNKIQGNIQNEIQRQTDIMMLTQYGFPMQFTETFIVDRYKDNVLLFPSKKI